MVIKNQITSDTQIHIMQTCKHAHMRMQNENIMQRIIHAAIMQNANASYFSGDN